MDSPDVSEGGEEDGVDGVGAASDGRSDLRMTELDDLFCCLFVPSCSTDTVLLRGFSRSPMRCRLAGGSSGREAIERWRAYVFLIIIITVAASLL